jgi:hypothetical protein
MMLGLHEYFRAKVRSRHSPPQGCSASEAETPPSGHSARASGHPRPCGNVVAPKPSRRAAGEAAACRTAAGASAVTRVSGALSACAPRRSTSPPRQWRRRRGRADRHHHRRRDRQRWCSRRAWMAITHAIQRAQAPGWSHPQRSCSKPTSCWSASCWASRHPACSSPVWTPSPIPPRPAPPHQHRALHALSALGWTLSELPATSMPPGLMPGPHNERGQVVGAGDQLLHCHDLTKAHTQATKCSACRG